MIASMATGLRHTNATLDELRRTCYSTPQMVVAYINIDDQQLRRDAFTAPHACAFHVLHPTSACRTCESCVRLYSYPEPVPVPARCQSEAQAHSQEQELYLGLLRSSPRTTHSAPRFRTHSRGFRCALCAAVVPTFAGGVAFLGRLAAPLSGWARAVPLVTFAALKSCRARGTSTSDKKFYSPLRMVSCRPLRARRAVEYRRERGLGTSESPSS
ncbi:hypothetical protein C8R45DRAFT_403725 [Mycena sanguinolenta]|nr:hypothetical protein C8R45DRAFT_403725 [Mycena sanguinolenta]